LLPLPDTWRHALHRKYRNDRPGKYGEPVNFIYCFLQGGGKRRHLHGVQGLAPGCPTVLNTLPGVPGGGHPFSWPRRVEGAPLRDRRGGDPLGEEAGGGLGDRWSEGGGRWKVYKTYQGFETLGDMVSLGVVSLEFCPQPLPPPFSLPWLALMCV